MKLHYLPTADEVREHNAWCKHLNPETLDTVSLIFSQFYNQLNWGMSEFNIRIRNERHTLTDDEVNTLHKFFFDKGYNFSFETDGTIQDIKVTW